MIEMVVVKRTMFVILVIIICVASTSSSLITHDVGDAVEKSTRLIITDIHLPIYGDISSKCSDALDAMAKNLLDPETEDDIWALKFIDSWGKTEDGTLFMFQSYKGSFDQCITTKPKDNSFKGKYCAIVIRALEEEKPAESMTKFNLDISSLQNPINRTYLLGKRELNVKPHILGHKHWFKGEERTVRGGYESDYVDYSTCMPSVCTLQELEQSLNIVAIKSNLTAKVPLCQVEDPDIDFTAGDISFIVVMSLLFLVILAASILDIIIYYSGNSSFASGPLKFLLPFSAYTNLHKMFQINTTPPPSNITCLNGMRVLSMTWVIYSHQMSVGTSTAINIEIIFQKLSSLLAQTVLNGFPSVDTFFFMSGLLVTYSVLRQMEKTGKFNIILYYVHRIIRLVPPLALVAWLNATVMRFYVTGPSAHGWAGVTYQCQKYWWKDLLFVNNFVDVLEGDCIGQTWYLAVDFQLYIVAPLIILPIYYSKPLGRAWLYVVSLVAIIIPGAVIYAYDLPPSNMMSDPKGYDFFLKVYIMPWCRAGPWVVGIWMGYILHKQGKRKVNMSPLMVTVGWTLATVTGLLVVYGIWSYNQFIPKAQYDIMTQVIYGSMHRAAWGAALAWIVFACHNGYGGMVDTFLSHPSWQPLSRLTYSIFLVVLNIQYAIILSGRVGNYFSHLGKVIETVGAIFVSLPIAILVSLMMESPVLGLEKLILAPRGKQQNNKPVDNGNPDIPLVLKGTDMEKPTQSTMETSQHHHIYTSHPQLNSQKTLNGYENIGFNVDAAEQERNFGVIEEVAVSEGLSKF